MAAVKAVAVCEEVPLYYTIAPEPVPALGARRSRPVLLAAAVAVACLAALTLGPQAAAAPVVLADSSVVDKIYVEVKAFESRIHSLQSEHSKKAADLKAQAEKEVQALHDKAAGVQADSTSKINKLKAETEKEVKALQAKLTAARADAERAAKKAVGDAKQRMDHTVGDLKKVGEHAQQAVGDMSADAQKSVEKTAGEAKKSFWSFWSK